MFPEEIKNKIIEGCKKKRMSWLKDIDNLFKKDFIE